MDANGSNPPNENGAALRELAARLLSPPYHSDGPSSEKPELCVGRLPYGLPAEVPIPEGATIVGSSMHGPHGGRLYEIVLDAPPTAERFRESFRQQLLAAGWREDDRLPGRSGFVPRGLPGLFYRAASRSSRLRRRMRGRVPGLPEILDHYLLGERGPRLMVSARDRKDAPADVRLRIAANQRSPWVHHDTAHTIIPSLVPPPDAHGRPQIGSANVLHPPLDARRMGGGDGDRESDGSYSYAVLETTPDLAALAAHYADQLEQAGWTRIEEGKCGPQSWSAWTITDEKGRPWTGTFTALALSGPPNRYLLQIHAGRTTAE